MNVSRKMFAQMYSVLFSSSPAQFGANSVWGPEWAKATEKQFNTFREEKGLGLLKLDDKVYHNNQQKVTAPIRVLNFRILLSKCFALDVFRLLSSGRAMSAI